MATEDFSFPIIGNAFICSIGSPQLWQLSPAASPDSCSHEEDVEDCFAPEPIKNSQRGSFSYAEDGGKEVNDGKDEDDHDHDHDNDNDDDEEEKMDMLWEEYFNEELSRSCSTSRSNTFSSRGMVELGCVKPLSRKPGMLLIMKVLKKLPSLLHKNSHGKLKMTRN